MEPNDRELLTQVRTEPKVRTSVYVILGVLVTLAAAAGVAAALVATKTIP